MPSLRHLTPIWVAARQQRAARCRVLAPRESARDYSQGRRRCLAPAARCGAPPNGETNACCESVCRGNHADLFFSAGSEGVKIRYARFRSDGDCPGRGSLCCSSRGPGTATTIRDYRCITTTAARAGPGHLCVARALARSAGVSLRMQWPGIPDLVGRSSLGGQPPGRAAKRADLVHCLPHHRQCRVSVHYSTVGSL